MLLDNFCCEIAPADHVMVTPVCTISKKIDHSTVFPLNIADLWYKKARLHNHAV